MDEVRLFYHYATQPHLKAFVLWGLGTAARPDAILDLHSNFIDLDNDIVELNPPGREQTKKSPDSEATTVIEIEDLRWISSHVQRPASRKP